MRHKTNVNSSGGGSIGVDLTVLWFYGVRPWPVAPSPLPLPPELTELRRARELALALVECGTGKSRSARLRLVPMHSLLPLSPLRALPRPGPPSLLLALSICLSYSLFLAPSFPHTDTPRLLYTSTRSTLHLIPLPSFFSIYIYICTYDTNTRYIRRFRLLFLFLSRLPFFFIFRFHPVSRAGAHANSRASPLFFLPHLFPPSPRFPVSTLTHVSICTYVRAYVHIRSRTR